MENAVLLCVVIRNAQIAVKIVQVYLWCLHIARIQADARTFAEYIKREAKYEAQQIKADAFQEAHKLAARAKEDADAFAKRRKAEAEIQAQHIIAAAHACALKARAFEQLKERLSVEKAARREKATRAKQTVIQTKHSLNEHDITPTYKQAKALQQQIAKTYSKEEKIRRRVQCEVEAKCLADMNMLRDQLQLVKNNEVELQSRVNAAQDTINELLSTIETLQSTNETSSNSGTSSSLPSTTEEARLQHDLALSVFSKEIKYRLKMACDSGTNFPNPSDLKEYLKERLRSEQGDVEEKLRRRLQKYELLLTERNDCHHNLCLPSLAKQRLTTARSDLSSDNLSWDTLNPQWSISKVIKQGTKTQVKLMQKLCATMRPLRDETTFSLFKAELEKLPRLKGCVQEVFLGDKYTTVAFKTKVDLDTFHECKEQWPRRIRGEAVGQLRVPPRDKSCVVWFQIGGGESITEDDMESESETYGAVLFVTVDKATSAGHPMKGFIQFESREGAEALLAAGTRSDNGQSVKEVVWHQCSIKFSSLHSF